MPSTGFEGVVGYPTQAESLLREEFRAIGGQSTVYTASIPLGPWTRLSIAAWGGGGGGQSGAVGATGSIRVGGRGGGGGGYSRLDLDLTPQIVAFLNAFTIVVGAGGLGGGTGNLIAGADGTLSGVYIGSVDTANFAIQAGGGLGSGNGGGGSISGVSSTVASATGSTGPVGTANATGSSQTAAPGGAAGGGRTSAGTNSAGGAGSLFTNGPAFQATSGAINGGTGGNGFDQITGSHDWPGTSGGGGGSLGGSGGSGGKGGFPGAGGGGGGAGTSNGAKGGDGGDGLVVLIWT